jgi:hypothetical protein
MALNTADTDVDAHPASANSGHTGRPLPATTKRPHKEAI